MHHVNIKYTATFSRIKYDQNSIKCLFLYSTPHPCHATVLPCKLCIIHHGMIVCLSHLFLCLCTLFTLALACLVLLRIDTEQGIYQEAQEHYPDPSLSATELPGKHYHMLAYIQYLLPLSYSCTIESRLH